MSCLNYASLNGSTCACPPGNAGDDCSELACGNPLLPSYERPVLSGISQTGCQGSSSIASQCASGFIGIGCNVCTSSQACQSAPAGPQVGTPSASDLGSAALNQTIVCSTDPYVYTEGFLECGVNNVALTSVFPGTTTLSIQKTLAPNQSLSYPYGDPGTALTQLWYSPNSSSSPIEQFYCLSTGCNQTESSDKASITYNCAGLQCTCIEEAAFCGGGGLDLTPVINGLQGPLIIECQTNSTQCSFIQSTLQNLFGQSGLALTGCSSGECVRQHVIDTSARNVAANASTRLSDGVIAGLAIVGAVVLALLALFAIGKLRQRKSRAVKAIEREQHPRTGLVWRDLSYALPQNGLVIGLRKRKHQRALSDKEKILEDGSSATPSGNLLLQSMSGTARAGSMLAIMGPSGAGKSTLVDILAGKRKAGTIGGTVNVLPLNEQASRESATIAYVDQEDILPATSTVREAMLFAADLKLPENTSKAYKEQRVQSVLNQLGLARVANSRIGSSERRGISGGERRRLSIGLELIAQPSIMILDEPTSGLDSVSALNVVEILRQLAHGKIQSDDADSPLLQTDSRTTIIATLHQPSQRIFQAFDSVLVLAEGGNTVYSGSASHAAASLGSHGHPLPDGLTPAEHLLEVASLQSSNRPRIIEAHSSSPSSTHKDFPSVPNLNRIMSNESDAYPPSAKVVKRNASPATGFMTQIEVLSGRESKNLIRDKSLFLSHIAVASVLGVFVGGMYFKADSSIAGFQNRIGALFFLGALTAFSALSALANLSNNRNLFLRERAASYYLPSTWLFSRIIFDILPLRMLVTELTGAVGTRADYCYSLPTIIVCTISYWMVGFAPHASNFFKFLLIFIEYSVAVSLFNFLVASIIPWLGVAVLFSAVLNLFQMAYAGFFVNLDRIPPVLRWLQWLCPLKYALEAVAVNEVNSGGTIRDTLAGVEVEVSATLIMELLFGFKPDAYGRDVLILLAWIVGFALAVVVSVQWRLRETR